MIPKIEKVLKKTIDVNMIVCTDAKSQIQKALAKYQLIVNRNIKGIKIV